MQTDRPTHLPQSKPLIIPSLFTQPTRLEISSDKSIALITGPCRNKLIGSGRDLVSLTRERERVSYDFLLASKKWLCSRPLAQLIFRQHGNYNGFVRGQKRNSLPSCAKLTWSRWLIRVLRTQGSALVRVATAQVQRRKWKTPMSTSLRGTTCHTTGMSTNLCD